VRYPDVTAAIQSRVYAAMTGATTAADALSGLRKDLTTSWRTDRSRSVSFQPRRIRWPPAARPVRERPAGTPAKWARRLARTPAGRPSGAARLANRTGLGSGRRVPAGRSVRQSFYGAPGIDPVTGFVNDSEPFVGLGNFADIFTDHGERFWNAIGNTTFFGIATSFQRSSSVWRWRC